MATSTYMHTQDAPKAIPAVQGGFAGVEYDNSPTQAQADILEALRSEATATDMNWDRDRVIDGRALNASDWHCFAVLPAPHNGLSAQQKTWADQHGLTVYILSTIEDAHNLAVDQMEMLAHYCGKAGIAPQSHVQIFDYLNAHTQATDCRWMGAGFPDGMVKVNDLWEFFCLKTPDCPYSTKHLTGLQKRAADTIGQKVYILGSLTDAESLAAGRFDEIYHFPGSHVENLR